MPNPNVNRRNAADVRNVLGSVENLFNEEMVERVFEDGSIPSSKVIGGGGGGGNASDINNDSAAPGATVADALTLLDGGLTSLQASDIENDSGVAGVTVSDALDNLESQVTSLSPGLIQNANLSLQATDDGLPNGDPRGISAVDLQTDRSSSDEVASGLNATVLGGKDNKAAGDYGVVAGRNMQVEASADNTTAIGTSLAPVSITRPDSFYIIGQQLFHTLENAEPADADLIEDGSVTLWIDETTDTLYAKAKRSDGVIVSIPIGDTSMTTNIQAADSPSVDAFGRWRTSAPFTLFDSKQIHSNQPLYFDDQETSGSGTSSTHSVPRASSTISVSNLTAGTRVRQTFQTFNYQSGKSQQCLFTFSKFDTTPGITKRVGAFNADNGMFLQSEDGVISVVVRSSTTGSPVDTVVEQSNWNQDVMDGTGVSGVTLDPSKSQILVMDYEWLGVGRVRYGFNIDGLIYYVHYQNNANNLDGVYTSTPNLPVRYEIINDGTGPADDFEQVCSTIISEGGQSNTGTLRHADSGEISSLTSASTYAVLGLRLKAANLDGVVTIETLSIVTTTGNDTAHWELVFNPTVAGTFTYSDETDSIVQVATGDNTNTLTGGIVVGGGYFTSSQSIEAEINNALRIGASIAGVPDEIVVAMRPITANLDAEASLTWRELS